MNNIKEITALTGELVDREFNDSPNDLAITIPGYLNKLINLADGIETTDSNKETIEENGASHFRASLAFIENYNKEQNQHSQEGDEVALEVLRNNLERAHHFFQTVEDAGGQFSFYIAPEL